jgi:hypothetical protein
MGLPQKTFKRLFAIVGRCEGLIATDSDLSRGAACWRFPHRRWGKQKSRRNRTLADVDPIALSACFWKPWEVFSVAICGIIRRLKIPLKHPTESGPPTAFRQPGFWPKN